MGDLVVTDGLRFVEHKPNQYDEARFKRTYHLWTLTGPEGCIQFKAWAEPPGGSSYQIALDFERLYAWDVDLNAWTGSDLGYHSLHPTYEGQEPYTDSCDMVGDRPCYFDGSSLAAQDLVREWVDANQDDDIIKARLREAYRDWLQADEEVCASPMTMLIVALKRAGAIA